jgi:hypothetical protein
MRRKKVKNSINKNKLTATIVTVLLIVSSFVLLTSTIQAQDVTFAEPVSGPVPDGETPSVYVDVSAHLSFRPNPVGLNEIFLVNIWTTPATYSGRYHPDYKVTITKPSGESHEVLMDSYNADATAWFEWIADEVGDWTIRFDFQGTYFPEGYYEGLGVFGGGPTLLDSAYYNPTTSGDWTLTVQEEPVYGWPELGITDDYWTRPVQVEHRDWWPSLGNWPATGYDGTNDPNWNSVYPNTSVYWIEQNKFAPWVEGPDSAHIVWKRQEGIAGIIGGQAKTYGLTASGATGPNIIYAGRCYDTYTKPVSGGKTMLRCYDLRTGEMYWETEASTTTYMWFGLFPRTTALVPDTIEYNPPTTSEVPGAEAAGTWSVNLMLISSGRLYKWDPWTGEMTCNVSLGVDDATFYRSATGRDTLPLALSVQNIGTPQDPNYRLIKWTTSGTSPDFSSRVISNSTYAKSSLPACIDWESGYGADVQGISQAEVYVGQRITGYDLWTGEELWTKEVMDEPLYTNYGSIAGHGKIAILSARGRYLAYDLASGNLAWTGEKMDYPWSSGAFGAYSAMSAYGMIFREAMDGIYAYSWDDGSIVWKYEADAKAVYETPYTAENAKTVMPFYSFGVGGIIADGKFFTWNYEHTESWPVTRGWSIHAIDVFTGEAVWDMMGCTTPAAVADGYLVGGNTYDGYVYCWGKGESETTVSAPDVAVPVGTSMTIKGSVLDLSPAQPGTPCVSAETMDTQMEYLHMQMPIGGLWGDELITGVPVTVCALKDDCTYVDLGVVVTDGYSGTFGLTWTPDTEGTYKILATFEGDVSYGSSSATTWVTVGPALAASVPVEPEPTEETSLISTELAIALGVVAVIAIGAVAFLLLKKRK